MNKRTTLKLNKEFKRLYFRGKSAVHPLLVTYAIKNRLGRNRIGITVTKKIGSLQKSLQAHHSCGVPAVGTLPGARVGFCFCGKDEDPTGKIYRPCTGHEKTDCKPY